MEFQLKIPNNFNKIDSDLFLNNILNIIGDFYTLTLDDLNVIFQKQNTVLKVRVYDDNTSEGNISLNRFEELIERIRTILSDTASFVIDRSVTSTRIPEEVARYLNLCSFMQTEKGSFVAKIQLPSEELIKDGELFERGQVYSKEINNKLSEVLSFVQQNILEGDVNVTDEYLIENEDKLNIKLLKDIETFYKKANLKNIDFSFHSIDNSQVIVNQEITGAKLYKLNQFVSAIESHTFDIGIYTFTGTITALKSKDPDGGHNGVTFACIFEDMPMIVAANLNSDQYKRAIEAHKMKLNITVTGQAKKTKTRARLIEILRFDVEE
ncbi:hypothetical protein [Fluviicola sp.]|uniref:hypothetical protein n=1 Tax=Fluviicola sp. TaxID=1917219 RepID=UPI0031D0D7B1